MGIIVEKAKPNQTQTTVISGFESLPTMGVKPVRYIDKEQEPIIYKKINKPLIQEDPKSKIMEDRLQKEATQIDLTLPFNNYTGPGTKIFKNILENKPPLGSADKIAYKHDIEYSLAETKSDIFYSDVRALKKNATTLPTSFTDLITKNLMTVGLGIKALMYDPLFANPKNDLLPEEKEFLINAYNKYD